MRGKITDISGKRFGRWTVIRLSTERQHRAAVWQCQCDCGTIKTVRGSSLIDGDSTSCGCIARALNSTKHTTHGESGTLRLKCSDRSPEYSVWLSMVARCHHKDHPSYDCYGGRGIRVCLAWRNSFEAFLKHVGRRPSKQHSIDRKDNDGHYQPGNVRWGTLEQQNNNRRRNRFLTFQDEKMTVAQWARKLNKPYGLLHNRITRGWSVARTLTT